MSTYLGGTPQLPIIFNNTLIGIATSLSISGSATASLDPKGNCSLVVSSGGGSVQWQEAGSTQTTGNIFNVTGSGGTLSNVGGVATLNIPLASNTILFEDEGLSVITSPTLNFVGAGVTLSNVGGVATATIPAAPNTLTFESGGSNVLTSGTLNVTGAGATMTNVGGVGTLNVPAAPNTINQYANGTLQGTYPDLKISGSAVTYDNTNHIYNIATSSVTINQTLNCETMYNPKNPTYGATGLNGDDTAALQACLNAAAASLPATVWIPPGQYGINTDVLVPAGDFQVPYITNANTGTGELTFSTNHGLYTGDPYMQQGFSLGGIFNGVLYHFRVSAGNRGFLYDTVTHAVAGGSTGLVLPSTNVTQTGSIAIHGTTLTLTATSLAGVELGTDVVINTSNPSVTDPGFATNGDFYVVGGVGTSTLTVNQPSDKAQTNVTVLYKTAIDWRFYDSGLKIIAAPGATFVKLQTFSGNALLNIALGSNVLVQGLEFTGLTTYIIDGITATTNATPNSSPVVTCSSTKGLAAGQRITIAGILTGGVIMTLTILTVDSPTQITLTVNANATVTGAVMGRAITQGDDLLRISSCHRVVIERCKFNHCGDSATRINTNVRDPLGVRTSDSVGGVQSGEVVIRDNYYYNCYQASSTTNDFIHGGARNIAFYNNKIELMCGSVKFANRVPGGKNLRCHDNSFLNCYDKGFEIDSMDTIDIHHNKFDTVRGYAVNILVNNGPVNGGFGTGTVGFPINNCHIHHNTFNNSGSAGGNMRFQMDLYADGTLFDYGQLDISYNDFINNATPGLIGVYLQAGSFQQFNMSYNKFHSTWKGSPLNAQIRASSTVGFVNNMKFDNNQIDMNNASLPVFRLQAASTNQPINNVSFSGNQISGTCQEVFQLGDLNNCKISNNLCTLTAGVFMAQSVHPNLNMEIINNTMQTGGTLGWFPTNITGLRMSGNHNTTSGGQTCDFDNTCSNVWYFNNEEIGGNVIFSQIPVNTKAYNKLGRREDGTVTPTVGTWRVGDMIDFTNAGAGGIPGEYCITSGTNGTIGTTTATTDGTTNTVTFSTMAGISIGAVINIVGVTGSRTIVSRTGLTAVVDGAVPAAVTGAAVSYSASVWKNFAAIAS